MSQKQKTNFTFEKAKLFQGFTLIELLVVISIIGILATIGLSSYQSSQMKARDAQRKSDLNQYRNALENYASVNNGVYPSRTGVVNAFSRLCADLDDNFISSCPQDPREDGSDYYYRYQCNGSGSGTSDATDYILWARMETGSATNNYWYVCANGKVSDKTSAPSKSDCGF